MNFLFPDSTQEWRENHNHHFEEVASTWGGQNGEKNKCINIF